MGFSHVTGQSADATTTSGTTVTAVFANNPTQGNTVCVGIMWYGGGATGTSIVSVKDGNNNDYTVTPSSPSLYVATAGQIFLAYLLSAPANADKTVTVTFNDTIAAAICWIDEFSSTGGTPTFDSDDKGTGIGTAINTPTVPVNGSNELLYGAAAYSSAIDTADSPWTGAASIEFGCYAEYDADASANQAIAFTGNDIGATWTSMGMSIGQSTVRRWLFGATH